MTLTSFRGTPLTNFSDHPVMFDGALYRYSENAYQAAKTSALLFRSVFQNPHLPPNEAKKLGQALRLPANWEVFDATGFPGKVAVMRTIIRDKAMRTPDVRRFLLGTGTEELIEFNHWGDQEWGQCDVNGLWVGHNYLGRIWMDLRAELRGDSF